jgi:hypothetical protein
VQSGPLVVVVVAAGVLAAFWEFTADDAYIYMRIAETFVDHRVLSFNLGERILMPTSTSLAFVDAALYTLTGATLTAYKVLSLLLLGASAALAVRSQPPDPMRRAIVLLAPSAVLWTVGGLDCVSLDGLHGRSASSPLRPACTAAFEFTRWDHENIVDMPSGIADKQQ